MFSMEYELETFNSSAGDLRPKIRQRPRLWQRVQPTETWRDLQETAIDIEDAIPGVDTNNTGNVHATDRTPLLQQGGSATSSVLSGGLSARATGAASTAAGGIGASGLYAPGALLIGAGAVYGGYKGLKSFQAPYHEYLGPGTNLEEAGTPVDRDDAIAREHDQAYEKVRYASDIVEADSIAIGKFEDDYRQTGNLHSKVSSTILGAKQALEHYIGPIYPQVCDH